jgi:hypothetical protein
MSTWILKKSEGKSRSKNLSIVQNGVKTIMGVNLKRQGRKCCIISKLAGEK